ncbi:MAG: type II secretion system protein GspL [Gammaproteobacteria bacterium]|nr:type II secretion system protein GspL [Gammaproteobacteria bacterium]
MRDILLIRIGEELDGQASWLRLGDTVQTVQIERGDIAEASNRTSGAQVVGLVPSAAVLLTVAKVPTQNKQRMLNAIPFALEEELATDVEDLHFAIGEAKDGVVPVAVVDRELMEKWQEVFRTAGITVDLLIPDIFVLPEKEDQWNLLLEQNSALLRTSDQSGMAFDTENLGLILPMLLKKYKESLPASLEVWRNEESSELVPLNSDELEIHSHNNSQGVLGLVNKESFDISKAINLLQGAFSPVEQFGKYLRPWRLAGGLLAVWFVIALTGAFIKSSSLESQSNALKAEAEKIYLTAFPEAKKVVKPKAQMQQKLRELKSGSGNAGITFMSLLADSGKVFRSTNGLVLRSIRYKNGTLDVDMELPNLQTLDQLKQSLMATKTMDVEIQSAASRNNKVQGRMQIKGKN